jgi:YD repeat-containing protein
VRKSNQVRAATFHIVSALGIAGSNPCLRPYRKLSPKRPSSRQILLVILALSAMLFSEAGFAQMKKQPAQKAVKTADEKLHPNADAACRWGLTAFLQIHNNSGTQTTTCPPYPPGSQSWVNKATYIAPIVVDGGHFSCRVAWSNTTTTVNSHPSCGSSGTHTSSGEQLQLYLPELRMCDSAFGWVQFDANTCYKASDPYPPARDIPKCGNPTSTGTGCKQESFVLARIPSGPRSIALELRYANQFPLAGGLLLGEPSWFLEPADRRLDLRFVASTSLPRVISARGQGGTEEFHMQGNGLYISFDPQVSLVKTSSPTAPWKRVDYSEGAVELFDSVGRLLSLRYFSGGGFDLSYASSTSLLPSRLTSTLGMQVQFTYLDGRLSAVQLPNASAIDLAYQGYSDLAKNIAGSYLKTITYPDGRSISFDYLAGMTLPPSPVDGTLSSEGKQIWNVSANSPVDGGPISPKDPLGYGRAFYNLSGITDENGLPFAGFQYDNQGRVLISHHGNNTYRHEFNYQTEKTVVTQPLGSLSTFNMRVVNGQLRLANVTRSAANFSHFVTFGFDQQGNLVSRADLGNQSAQCMKVDPLSNRPVVLLEGVTACPADMSTYLPTGDERKISTQWHPDWRLESSVAEPGRLKTYIYNGQPDPFAAGATASCAPAAALLPDGKPIAVLCKQVEQATTDANGSLGFSAPLQSGVTPRVQTWTYNQYGQILTAKGPRTDVNDTTTYTHYTDTVYASTDPYAQGHNIGDLWTMTNAVGQVTTYTKYNKSGQLLEMVDPNNVVATNTYDLRQRLTSVTVGGQMTVYDYWPTGLLKKITQPDGSFLSYEYDAAHRQTAVEDNFGNRIDYTLDNAGNRTFENTKDPTGNLRRALERSIDALGRVQQTTGRE